VRLIRSKGVGVYFVTQSPLDLPESVLGQLGNRVQHALRAFTPRDQRAVKAAAETFRANPHLDVAKAIGELAVGEALVSFLDSAGTPGIVQRAWVAPPASRHGPLTPAERREAIEASPLRGRYDQAVDRPSAYESLRGEADAAEAAPPAEGAPASPSGARPTVWNARPSRPAEEEAPRPARTRATVPAAGGRGGQSIGEAMAKSLARSVASSIGSRIGREIVRGVLGSIIGGTRRR
jgi:DNA double-strand break repair helicase HerA and related ATPase